MGLEVNKTPIVFFGSGPVAARSLEMLYKHTDVVAVVTKPKPTHHKGDFPVISLAQKLNIPIYTATNKSDLSELISKKPFHTEVAILIDFGIIVAQDVIDYFPMGIINSHFSLLPEWRGADPITYAILSGQPKTGVSLMLVDKGMDTGKIIKQTSLEIKPQDTTDLLTDRLLQLSDEMLIESLDEYINGKITPRSQPHPDRATYSRKLTKKDSILDFAKSATQLEREIRAFAKWPKSKTNLAGIDVIITQAHVVPSSVGKLGDIEIVKQAGIIMIQCADGYLCIDSLKPAGKSEMSAKAFISGYGNKLAIAK